MCVEFSASLLSIHNYIACAFSIRHTQRCATSWCVFIYYVCRYADTRTYTIVLNTHIYIYIYTRRNDRDRQAQHHPPSKWNTRMKKTKFFHVRRIVHSHIDHYEFWFCVNMCMETIISWVPKSKSLAALGAGTRAFVCLCVLGIYIYMCCCVCLIAPKTVCVNTFVIVRVFVCLCNVCTVCCVY